VGAAAAGSNCWRASRTRPLSRGFSSIANNCKVTTRKREAPGLSA
jgi:hypothetical protein